MRCEQNGASVVVSDLAELLDGVTRVIEQSAYPVEPWVVRETNFNLDLLAQSESVFALSNGHIGMRGNLDEGEPHGIPGMYLNSFYEQRPLPYAEAGYGYPESGQTVVNVTDGKLIRVLVNDEPLDVRYGELRSHERLLDFRAGTLTRSLDWVSPAGQRVRVRSRRLVSFVQRAVAAIEYIVEPVDAPARFVIQSELVANEELPRMKADPRVSAILDNPLVGVEHSRQDNGGDPAAPHPRQRAVDGRRDGPHHRRPRPARDRRRLARGLGAHDGRRAPAARASG